MDIAILKKIEKEIKLFLENIKEQAENTEEAGGVIKKYLLGEQLNDEDEKILKTQLIDWLKIFGVVIPFVLIPGASILMPFIIKVAKKYNIELMPSAFQDDEEEKKEEKK
jgi:hypothetical protein